MMCEIERRTSLWVIDMRWYWKADNWWSQRSIRQVSSKRNIMREEFRPCLESYDWDERRGHQWIIDEWGWELSLMIGWNRQSTLE
jgi:hypothetical protein